MSLTVGELRAAIANAPDDASVTLVYEGAMRHAVGVTAAPNGMMVVLRTICSERKAKHFSVVEDGLIGGFASMGMSDDDIAEILGRPTDSVTKRRKTLKRKQLLPFPHMGAR